MGNDTSINSSSASFDSSGTATKVRRPPRLFYASTLGIGLLLAVVSSVVVGHGGTASAEIHLKDLPIPTEIVVWVGRRLQDPLGLTVAVSGFLFVALLTLKGILDRILRLLIGLNFVWLLLFLAATLLSWKAIFGLAEHFNKPPPG